MANSFAARLLIATPKLVDPNFYRAVVFICTHDENGAFGLVLNRPIEGEDLGEHLPEAAARGCAESRVRRGTG